jgi:hypothetical protein
MRALMTAAEAPRELKPPVTRYCVEDVNFKGMIGHGSRRKLVHVRSIRSSVVAERSVV